MSLDAPAAAGALSWRGYRRLDFELGGRASLLVLPDRPAPGRPWIWRTQFFDHEPQADVALLGLGLHVAFTDMPDLYGGPEAMARMDAFWELLVHRHGLTKLDMAFFNVNGVLSIGMLLATLGDLLFSR